MSNIYFAVLISATLFFSVLCFRTVPMWLKTLAAIMVTVEASWLLFILFIKFVFWCFSLAFTLKMATGIYALIVAIFFIIGGVKER